ncbi:hypothetical protein HDU82_000103 [Entophlyctis luteolus]|nr:hypothetical protein HDU82_000103 [Entophlyctis luteolus]
MTVADLPSDDGNETAPEQRPFLTTTTPAAPGANSLILDSSSSSTALFTEGDDACLDKPAQALSKFAFTMVFVGLSLGVFLASLDMTIVTVALSAIAAEFQDLTEINWIATGYLLTSTAFIPIYDENLKGQLADVVGRKLTFLLAIGIFEFGSLLCGVAVNMKMLIAARAIAGLGGSGIFSLVMIIISDLTTPKERGQYMGIVGAIFGVASVAGPLIGGAFVDRVFYINLPIGFFTIFVVVFFLKLGSKTESLVSGIKRIDWIGSLLLITSVICLLVPLQGGGSQYAWNSPTVIVLLIFGICLLISFCYVEGWVSKNPVLPFSIFKNRQTAASFVTIFFLGCGFFVLIFYAPLWFQIVKGSSATEAGVATIPLIMGLVVFSILSGVVASLTGHYFPFIPLCALLVATGGGLLTTLNEDSKSWQQVLYLLIAGAGLGCGVQTVLMSAQTSVSSSLISVITACTNFFQTIGAVIGLAIASSIFNNNLVSNIGDALVSFNTSLDELQPAGLLYPGIIFENPLSIHNSSIVADGSTLQHALIRGYLNTVSPLFYLPVGFAAAFLVVCFWVKRDKLAHGTELSMGA